MLLPTPSRLQDVAADYGLGKANLVGSTQWVAHHRLGLVEVTNFNPAQGPSLEAILSSRDLENIAPTVFTRVLANPAAHGPRAPGAGCLALRASDTPVSFLALTRVVSAHTSVWRYI
jgi:hypothetical protein